MASTTKKIERTPAEIEKLARRDLAQSNKQVGPITDAVPLGRVMELRRLGSTLRQEREKQNLTQAQLAAKIGMDEPAISRIEKGLNLNPTLDTLNRIAAGLGKEIEVVLSNEPTTERAVV
ncbi:MAG: helix-turn-helix domain-containing protein [Planctomycetes bacterium]|nr:helix-turn-helix domain-containing protein [Planctomycetota bacterium]